MRSCPGRAAPDVEVLSSSSAFSPQSVFPAFTTLGAAHARQTLRSVANLYVLAAQALHMVSSAGSTVVPAAQVVTLVVRLAYAPKPVILVNSPPRFTLRRRA